MAGNWILLQECCKHKVLHTEPTGGYGTEKHRFIIYTTDANTRAKEDEKHVKELLQIFVHTRAAGVRSGVIRPETFILLPSQNV